MTDMNEKLRGLLFGTELRPVNRRRLAQLVGVHVNTIYNWERDPSIITVSNLRKLCGAQGIDFRELGEAIGGKC